MKLDWYKIECSVYELFCILLNVAKNQPFRIFNGNLCSNTPVEFGVWIFVLNICKMLNPVLLSYIPHAIRNVDLLPFVYSINHTFVIDFKTYYFPMEYPLVRKSKETGIKTNVELFSYFKPYCNRREIQTGSLCTQDYGMPSSFSHILKISIAPNSNWNQKFQQEPRVFVLVLKSVGVFVLSTFLKSLFLQIRTDSTFFVSKIV